MLVLHSALLNEYFTFNACLFKNEHMSVGAKVGQRRAVYLVELEFPVIVMSPIGVLGTELWSLLLLTAEPSPVPFTTSYLCIFSQPTANTISC